MRAFEAVMIVTGTGPVHRKNNDRECVYAETAITRATCVHRIGAFCIESDATLPVQRPAE